MRDPGDIDRDLRDADVEFVGPFLSRTMPGIEPTVLAHAVCMYTMTPDEHFVIDRFPDRPNVAFAAGFSGHGFKFAPVVGSVLADLVLEGRTCEPVGFLRRSRFNADEPIEHL